MSQWRRISLEQVPSCKQTIEEAKDTVVMWLHLWDEYFSAYSKPTETAKMEQIYRFALQCSKDKKLDPWTSGFGYFFYHLVGQFVIENRFVMVDLPRRMSSGEFEYWLDSVKHEFPKERINNAIKAFNVAKHKAK